MFDICEGAAATGEDAYHPGESILAADNSFQELQQPINSIADKDVEEEASDQEVETAYDKDEVCLLFFFDFSNHYSYLDYEAYC